MTSSVALSLIILAQPYGLDDRIKQVSPENGYRDYMLAARDYSLDKRMKELFGWLWLKEPRTIDRPKWVPQSASGETLYSMLDALFKPIRTGVQVGNSKPVDFPKNGLTPMTLFGELSCFREIAKVNMRLARQEARAGNIRSATTRFLETMTFARNVANSRAPTIPVSVGQAIQNIAVLDAAIDLHLHSDESLKQIEAVAQKNLQLPNPLGGALELEVSTYPELLRLVKECDEDTWSLNKEFLKPPTAKLKAEFARISPERTQVLYNAYVRQIENGPLSLAKRLQDPEAEWLKPFEVISFHRINIEVRPTPDEGVFLYCCFRPFSFVEWSDEILVSALKNQVRLRLRTRMFLKAVEVARFRLLHGRLPKDSTEVWGRRPNDPITRYPYQFRAHPDGVRFQVRSWFDERFVSLGTPPEAP